MGLILKAGLDTAYSKTVPDTQTVQALGQTLAQGPWPQVIVLLITLVRFVYGIYRLHEEATDELEPRFLVWNVIAMVVLFVLFYASGLAIVHAAPFYVVMIAVHVWAGLWSGVNLQSQKLRAHAPEAREAAKRFVLLDAGTAFVLFWFMFYRQGDFLIYGSLVAMLVIAILDYSVNREFLLGREQKS